MSAIKRAISTLQYNHTASAEQVNADLRAIPRAAGKRTGLGRLIGLGMVCAGMSSAMGGLLSGRDGMPLLAAGAAFFVLGAFLTLISKPGKPKGGAFANAHHTADLLGKLQWQGPVRVVVSLRANPVFGHGNQAVIFGMEGTLGSGLGVKASLTRRGVPGSQRDSGTVKVRSVAPLPADLEARLRSSRAGRPENLYFKQQGSEVEVEIDVERLAVTELLEPTSQMHYAAGLGALGAPPQPVAHLQPQAA